MRRNAESKKDVYLLGLIYPFGELNIMGIYLDKRKLIAGYELLIEEYNRCAEPYSEVPVIYRFPIDTFLGEKVLGEQLDNPFIFYEKDNIEVVSIEKVKEQILLTCFYGFNVYCDLNFTEGAFIDLEYCGGGENDYCWIRMNIEDGTFISKIDYLGTVIQAWYRDNKKYLLEIYKTKSLINIPEWEED